MIEDNEIQERGTLAAFQIDKDTKRVESLADYHLYDNGQRVYTPANKPSAADIGAVPKTDVVSGSGYAQLAGKIPRIGSDGVLEVARYIDFHTKDSTTDFDVRLDCYDANNLNVTGGKLKVDGYEVYTTASGSKPFKVHSINKPSGVVDGKYYPVVITGALHNQQVYISTRQSGGNDPMNNCSFAGEVRAMGWTDGTSYAQGMFTQYYQNENAIHSIWMNSESEGVYAFYVEARAFPITVRADSSCGVTVHTTDYSNGTSVYPAGVTLSQLNDSNGIGTKIRRLQLFSAGTGFYRHDGVVNDQSVQLTGNINFDHYNVGGTYNIYNPSTESVNKPPFSYGTLFVVGRGNAAYGFVTQYATDKQSRKTFVRTRNDDSAKTWTPWVQIYDSANKPTPADLGAVNKAGDTLTGTLTTKDVKVAAGSKIMLPTTDFPAGATIETIPAGDTFGANLIVSSCGNTVIGSGESASNLKTLTNGENLFLTSDGEIQFITNANAWADRKIVRFNNAADLLGVRNIDNSGTIKTASWIEAGGTVKTTIAGTYGFIAERNGHQVIIGNSATSGEYLFGGKAASASDYQHYIRLGNNKFQYHQAGKDFDVYHTGRKPTAGDVGAIATGAAYLKAETYSRSEVDSRLTGKTIGNAKALGTEDLDTIKTAGVYSQSANANTSAARHYPENQAGSLVVTYGAGPIQTYHVYNSSRVWTRAQYSTGGWSTWARQYNTLNKPTAADVGALPLAGGTVTGDIKIQKAKAAVILRGAGEDIPENYGRIKFEHNSGDQHVHILHSVHDTHRAPFGLRIQKGEGNATATHKAWLEAEGEIYADGDKRVYHAGNKPTAADVGALPITGGVLTGALHLDHGDYRHRFVQSNNIAFFQGGHETSETDHQIAFSGYNGKVLNLTRFYMANNVSPVVRWGSTDHKIYHAGNKPTAADVGALASGGTAVAATKLATARTIAGVSFDGTANISLTAANVGAFNATGSTGSVAAADGVSWGAASGVYTSRNNGDSDLITQFKASGNSCPSFQLKARYKNGGLWYRTARDSLGFERDWARVYTTDQKPTAAEVGAMAAVNPTYPLTSSAGWHIIGRVRLPQSAATVKVEIVGGCGFNTGSMEQTALTEIVIRSGNNNPKGISVSAYCLGGTSDIIADVAWKAVSGDDYDIYVNASSYGNAGLIYHAYASPNASFTFTATASNLGTTKPTGLTDGRKVRAYSTANKPTAADVGALPLAGGTVTGNATFNSIVNIQSGNLKMSGVNVMGAAADVVRVGDGDLTRPLNLNAKNGEVYVQLTGAKHRVYHVGFKPTAADVGLGNVPNTEHTANATANTVAVRDGSADLNARLFRSNYANQSTISGAMAFRINNGSDNYIRFCSDAGAIRNWLGVVALAGSSMSGALTTPKVVLHTKSTSWIDMRTSDGCIQSNSAVGNSSASVIVRQEHADRHFMIGGLGNSQFGFYMINKSQTTNGTNASAYLMHDGVWYCGGNVNANDVYIRSDKRMKSDLVQVENALAKVSKLTAYSYNKHKSITDSEVVSREVGLIAQDLQKVLPEAVNEAEDTTLTISNSAVNALLVEAIKELKAEIEELKRGQGK
ncbi:MAG: tail fiber domain-containing protein [Aeromonas veronii]